MSSWIKEASELSLEVLTTWTGLRRHRGKRPVLGAVGGASTGSHGFLLLYNIHRERQLRGWQERGLPYFSSQPESSQICHRHLRQAHFRLDGVQCTRSK